MGVYIFLVKIVCQMWVEKKILLSYINFLLSYKNDLIFTCKNFDLKCFLKDIFDDLDEHWATSKDRNLKSPLDSQNDIIIHILIK